MNQDHEKSPYLMREQFAARDTPMTDEEKQVFLLEGRCWQCDVEWGKGVVDFHSPCSDCRRSENEARWSEYRQATQVQEEAPDMMTDGESFQQGYAAGAQDAAGAKNDEGASSAVLVEPVDLVAEGEAVAKMLAIVAQIPDVSRPRVLNTVFELVRTAPGIARPENTWDGYSPSAESLAKLSLLIGDVRGDEDDAP